MYTLRVKDHFNAAHFLKGYPGDCANIHGHTWYIEVVIQGKDLGALNMLIDFKEVKRVLKQLLNVVDHKGMLNDILKVQQPTAEYIAKWAFLYLSEALAIETDGDESFQLSEVIIWESPECSITYTPDIVERKLDGK